MHYIEQLKDGDRVSEVYLCKSKSTALTKAGREYENVLLQDKTGVIDSKIWDPMSGELEILSQWIMLQLQDRWRL